MLFPFVVFMNSFWSRGKPEQSNLKCLHLLYQEQQAQTQGQPGPELHRSFWNPEEDADYFLTQDTQDELASLQNGK